MHVWDKRYIAWEHEHISASACAQFRVSSKFHGCFYNSIGTWKKCFLFPLLKSLLKTIKKINLLILIRINLLILIYIRLCKE